MNLTNSYLIAKQQREEFEANKPRSWSRGKRGEIRRQLDAMWDQRTAELNAIINQRGLTNEQEEKNLF